MPKKKTPTPKKEESAWAWKIQAEAIAGLVKEIAVVRGRAEQEGMIRRRSHAMLIQELGELKMRVRYVEWIKNNTLFWLTILVLSLAVMNLVLSYFSITNA